MPVVFLAQIGVVVTSVRALDERVCNFVCEIELDSVSPAERADRRDRHAYLDVKYDGCVVLDALDGADGAGNTSVAGNERRIDLR